MHSDAVILSVPSYLALQTGEVLEDDGVKIEPFNLKQEREEGFFDAEGNYVEYRVDNGLKVS